MGVGVGPNCCCLESCTDCCSHETWNVYIPAGTYGRSGCSCSAALCADAINDRTFVLERVDTCRWEYTENTGCTTITIILSMSGCIRTVRIETLTPANYCNWSQTLPTPLDCCLERTIPCISLETNIFGCACHVIGPNSFNVPSLTVSC